MTSCGNTISWLLRLVRSNYIFHSSNPLWYFRSCENSRHEHRSSLFTFVLFLTLLARVCWHWSTGKKMHSFSTNFPVKCFRPRYQPGFVQSSWHRKRFSARQRNRNEETWIFVTDPCIHKKNIICSLLWCERVVLHRHIYYMLQCDEIKKKFSTGESLWRWIYEI